MALSNPLIFYLLLKLITLLMPDCPFRLAFIQRTDEREYDDLVCCYGLVERPVPSREE